MQTLSFPVTAASTVLCIIRVTAQNNQMDIIVIKDWSHPKTQCYASKQYKRVIIHLVVTGAQ